MIKKAIVLLVCATLAGCALAPSPGLGDGGVTARPDGGRSRPPVGAYKGTLRENGLGYGTTFYVIDETHAAFAICPTLVVADDRVMGCGLVGALEYTALDDSIVLDLRSGSRQIAFYGTRQ